MSFVKAAQDSVSLKTGSGRAAKTDAGLLMALSERCHGIAHQIMMRFRYFQAGCIGIASGGLQNRPLARCDDLACGIEPQHGVGFVVEPRVNKCTFLSHR